MGCAVLGVLLTIYPPNAYFGVDWLRYVAANLVFLNFLKPALPGVFVDNPLVPAVNGALWTLKIEVAFYAAVPIIALLVRRWDWRWVVAALFIASVIYTEAMQLLAHTTGKSGFLELAKQLPGQMTYFCVGMAAYFLSRTRRLPLRGILLCAVVAYALSLIGLTSVFRPLAVGGIVLALGYGPYLGNFSRNGDFSYGIYILHYPILQTLIHAGWFDGRPLLLIVVGYGIALIGSILLWHAVEKRFLPRRSHYTEGERAALSPSGRPRPATIGE